MPIMRCSNHRTSLVAINPNRHMPMQRLIRPWVRRDDLLLQNIAATAGAVPQTQVKQPQILEPKTQLPAGTASPPEQKPEIPAT